MKAATNERPAATPASTPSPPGTVWIAGATFLMGSDRHYPEEAPAHRAHVDGFWMDTHTVTNRDFKRFVEATGYVTVAERPADAADYPGADPAMLLPASVVFVKAPRALDMSDHYQWWRYVQGADWRHPGGPGTSLQGLWEHPVVQVAFEDAEAYARWRGKMLPTEAEWELAARGGLDAAEFVWGDELTPGGRVMANTWQGDFPWQNLLEDGFETTAPVGTFRPNGYGLYDMAGNVWQWTTDWFQDHGRIKKACCTIDNPRGGARDASFEARTPGVRIPRKVIKGGSFICAPNYCRRYRPAARMAQEVNSATCHIGFRCILRPDGD
jgi:formylglycine-generating enzyme